MSISLGVGIVTYNNSKKQIATAISSLCKSMDRAGNGHSIDSVILIAQNGSASNQNLIDVVCAAQRVVQLSPTGNIGFGSAMNALMRTAFCEIGTDYFFALNPDTYTHPDAISNLVRAAITNADSVIEARQFPDEHPKYYSAETGETDWASGACMMLPRSVYDATDGFDSNFFMYMEDVDLSWRARGAGARILHCASALIGHQTTDRDYSPSSERLMFESGLYLGCKWQHKSFQQWCAGELQHRCGLAPLQVRAIHLASLKRCELLPAKWCKAGSSVANFDQYFSFARTRW